jgi:cytochrome b561
MPHAYAPAQRALHWAIAAAVVVLVPVGLAMTARGNAGTWDGVTNALYSWHKAIGFAVLLAMAARIVLRLRLGVPPYPQGFPPRFATLARWFHRLLYALLVAVPLLGWAGVTSFPALVTVGGMHLPPMPFVPVDQALSKALFALHGTLALALAALALVHVLALVVHVAHWRHVVLARMWPRR